MIIFAEAIPWGKGYDHLVESETYDEVRRSDTVLLYNEQLKVRTS